MCIEGKVAESDQVCVAQEAMREPVVAEDGNTYEVRNLVHSKLEIAFICSCLEDLNEGPVFVSGIRHQRMARRA